MRKPLTIREFNLSFALSPPSRRGAYSLMRGSASLLHDRDARAAVLFLDGKALPIGRHARLEEALAAAVGHMGRRPSAPSAATRRADGSNLTRMAAQLGC
jgi:hypothetical protein